MKELHGGNAGKTLTRLASSFFRRPIRIFLPPLIASFMVVNFIRLGFYTYGDMHHDGWARFAFWQEVRPPISNSLFEQVTHYYDATSRFFDVFRFDSYMDYPYDGHLWTIPVEFRYSIVLFSLMAALCVTRPPWRLILVAIVWIYCVWLAAWEPMLFIGGLLLAQIGLMRGHGKRSYISDELPLVEVNEKREQSQRRRKVAMIVLFIAGLYLTSVPDYKRMFISFPSLATRS
jgi:peptidoglycan/LPS O-acetylase OafA/YrhL